jgi:23S rRNA (uracil1939-C5)-methyltransferase
VVFIDGRAADGAGQRQRHRRKNNWEQAQLTAIHRESSQRVRPRCPHFGLHEGACGGCKMQHLHPAAQVAVKQRVLEDNLWHLGKVKPETVLRPIEGPAWNYRWRARFSVRHVRKKGAVLVGFHERKSRYVADIRECHVVPKQVSDLLLPLRALIGSMEAIETCPQIELACGDDVIALVLRHLEPLSAGDLAKLRASRRARGRAVVAAAQGARHGEAARRGRPGAGLRAAGIRHPHAVPADRLHPGQPAHQPRAGDAGAAPAGRAADERVIDWFCGLGNFTLPLATQAREVLGHRRQRNAGGALAREPGRQRAQPATSRRRVRARNLFEMTPQQLAADGVADKWLVDPPREGAFALGQGAGRRAPAARTAHRAGRRRAHRLRQLQSGHAGP